MRTFFEDKSRGYKEYLEKRGDLKPSAVTTLLIPVASFFSRNRLPENQKITGELKSVTDILHDLKQVLDNMDEIWDFLDELKERKHKQELVESHQQEMEDKNSQKFW